MSTPKNMSRSAVRRFFMAVVCTALLLLLSSVASAQTTVTATPNSIADPAKPPPVVLHVADPSVVAPVVKVTVDGTDVQFQKDVPAQGSITITPPANLSGTKTVQLLDTAGKVIGQAQLTYPGGGASNASPTPSPSPTPDGAEARRNKLVNTWWFYPFIVIAFLAVLLPFVYTIVRGILFSRATFRNPLGMPEGSFRAMVAYTLVAFLGFYVLASLLTVSDFAPPQFLLGIVATVIGFYFGSRTSDERNAGAPPPPTQTGTVQGTVKKADETLAGGASVELTGADGKKLTQTADAASGVYKFANVPAGTYSVKASLAGASSDPSQVSVTAGGQTKADLKLK